MLAIAEPDSIQRLTRDLKVASITLSQQEARYLTDAYYQIQDYRIQAANQRRALGESGEHHSIRVWRFEQMETLENQIKRALDAGSAPCPEGRWAKSIVGIGPVLAAGFLAHIDITRAPTVGHIWSFAGLNPTAVWEKKTKRPWNARLKVLCWKLSQSFLKFHNHERDFYGHLMMQRKAQEQERNAAGLYAEQAANALTAKKIGKDTEAYKWYSQGMLPPAHIQARAGRWAVKLFLAHYHEVSYTAHYGAGPPPPYVLDGVGHAGEIQVPHWVRS